MYIKRLTNPGHLPVTLAEAKAHLLDTPDVDDEYITGLIYAAAEYCETYCRRSLDVSDYVAYLDGFPSSGTVNLQKSPAISVANIKYYDTANALQTLDPSLYIADVDSEPARVRFYNVPATYDRPNSVFITFRAGYADVLGAFDASLVPQSIKRAMLLIIGHLYNNREQVVIGVSQTEIDFGVDKLLEPHRLYMF